MGVGIYLDEALRFLTKPPKIPTALEFSYLGVFRYSVFTYLDEALRFLTKPPKIPTALEFSYLGVFSSEIEPVERVFSIHRKNALYSRSWLPFLQNMGTVEKEFLFPGRHGRGHINPVLASHILRELRDCLGLEKLSIQSFRRTGINAMRDRDVSLEVIQKISSHASRSKPLSGGYAV